MGGLISDQHRADEATAWMSWCQCSPWYRLHAGDGGVVSDNGDGHGHVPPDIDYKQAHHVDDNGVDNGDDGGDGDGHDDNMTKIDDGNWRLTLLVQHMRWYQLQHYC